MISKDKQSLPRPLRGFEGIYRFWDHRKNSVVAKVLPGEYYVTKHPELINTLLGSCIAACIRDPIANVGGLNHFLLPIKRDGNGVAANKPDDAARYGNWAMEHLINGILKAGGERERLEVKIFGGGAILDNFVHCNIGDKNIDFIRDYLRSENMEIIAEDVGGTAGRMVVYNPLSGEVMVKKLADSRIENEERKYIKDIRSHDTDGDVELFD